LTPEFDSDVEEYSATTENDTDTITATPTNENATVVILNGSTEVENGEAATWSAGENTVNITVTDWDDSSTYTVTVTKE
jgi:hypothetical protein